MYVLQNSRPTKILFHALPNCKAKSMLQLNSVNINDSTSVEHNSKTLAQNKFNTRQPLQNLTGLLANSCAQTKLLSLEAILLRPTLFALFVSLRLHV